MLFIVVNQVKSKNYSKNNFKIYKPSINAIMITNRIILLIYLNKLINFIKLFTLDYILIGPDSCRHCTDSSFISNENMVNDSINITFQNNYYLLCSDITNGLLPQKVQGGLRRFFVNITSLYVDPRML